MGSGSVAARVINTLLVLIVALLGLRAVFVLFDGNPDNGIVAFVNAVAAFLLAPFVGMFRRQSELITVLVGVLAYCLVAGVALAIENRVGPGRSDETPAGTS